jgi:23S rRNA (cytosine1962-C5)-methyltransferase
MAKGPKSRTPRRRAKPSAPSFDPGPGCAVLPYELLDSGNGRKLERFGAFVLDRPCAVSPWKPRLPAEQWEASDAVFSREGGNHWSFRRRLPRTWVAEIDGLQFIVGPTDFGHVGVFPEHSRHWSWIRADGRSYSGSGEEEKPRVLNLFAYTGGATMAAAATGAEVWHLDASRKSVAWARENAARNRLSDAPIHWTVDDVRTWLSREIRRGRRHHGIIMDPPSFGRGKRDELFKIETHLTDLLGLCRQVLTPQPLFLILTCHTPGYTPVVLRNLLAETMRGLPGRIEADEMSLPNPSDVMPVPSGACAIWHALQPFPVIPGR